MERCDRQFFFFFMYVQVLLERAMGWHRTLDLATRDASDAIRCALCLRLPQTIADV